MQGKHKVAAVLAIAVFGCEFASLAASFVTHNKNSYGVNNFQAIRQSISSMGPFSLNMAEERDYISPMRQRKLSPPPLCIYITSRCSHNYPSFRLGQDRALREEMSHIPTRIYCVNWNSTKIFEKLEAAIAFRTSTPEIQVQSGDISATGSSVKLLDAQGRSRLSLP